MPHTDYMRLIDRGRRAGLGTSELYQALRSRPPEAGDQPYQTDSNGYIRCCGPNGERDFRPVSGQSS